MTDLNKNSVFSLFAVASVFLPGTYAQLVHKGTVFPSAWVSLVILVIKFYE